MRFVCESCRAQYMINDEKVGPKGVKVRCRKCGYVILVKRADGAKGGPVAMSNDPDDALATQVMQTPLAPAEATLSNEDSGDSMTNPGTGTSSPTLAEAGANGANGNGASKDSFFGADEDEIGAVFDQVLKGGGAKEEGSNGAADAKDGNDDRQSTRVIDADTVRKLAEESGVVEKPAAPEPKAEEVPQTDWYCAINEKQTGPLTLDKLKEHWDKGEIGADSLCWRAGFDDWIPVSEVKMLAAVLAPKPPKPIVVAPAATITQSTPALVSMPVQSAFSAGGMVQTVQSEVQVPVSAVAASSIADREESGTWKPSAASALASLVRDEMEALAKPPPKPVVEEPPAAKGGGLLDLPEKEAAATNSAVVLPSTIEERPARPPPPPVNPYLANPGATYSAPAVTQYRPPSNRNLMIGMAAGGGVLLLILIGLVVWLAVRDPIVVTAPQQPQVAVVTPQNPPVNNNPPPVNNTAPTNPPANNTAPANNPPANNTAPANTPPANNTAPANTPPANNTAPANPPTNNTAPANPPTNNTAPVAPVSPKTPKTPKTPKEPKEVADPPEPKEPKKTAPKGDPDDFDSVFNTKGSSAPKEEAKADPVKKPEKYIPPAPGGGDVKDSLGQSDIMEVVVANKGALAACTAKKEAGTSGKIVMKWEVATSGKVTKVGLGDGSEDFKGTPMAQCFSGAIKAMVFPKHKTQHEPIVFPFKF
ncbi:MAG: adventurous gliding motility protein GltJ [Myxococcaceae bacterium]